MAGTRFVLVHGAWHGGWCWDAVAADLCSRGHHVDAVDLPGRTDPAEAGAATLEHAVATVRASVEAASGQVVLVAHSLGGITATQVAARVPERIARLVYVGAFVPGHGQSFRDLASTEQFRVSVVAQRKKIDVVAGLTYPPAPHEVEAFFEACDPEIARGAVARLVPESLAFDTHPVSLPDGALDGVARTYVETLRDKALPIASQRAMHTAAGITDVVSLDTDHSPFFSRISELTELLLATAPRTGMTAPVS
ncbi:alpha/beta fold hydrolase [Amycolatopsis sp. NPDC051372]|uniref:alpha/beta fold hydrolase n=1 Tax=Amycolatopsis sp. NPDC051372 TaxID=3155669 RepID=UPI0034491F73